MQDGERDGLYEQLIVRPLSRAVPENLAAQVPAIRDRPFRPTVPTNSGTLPVILELMLVYLQALEGDAR